MFKKFEIDVQPWRDITAFGSIFIYGLILLAMLALQQFELFYRLLLGFIITYVIILLIRAVYFRKRPNKRTYKNFIEKLDASSFPSIHAARVTFLAGYLSYHFNQLYLTIFLIFVALLTIYSRFSLKKHDWIDLIAGIVVGGVTFYIMIIV
jgi:membrane-associated phospholipid phosphatase